VNADDRRFEVLRAIVTDYVATHEPVASRSLVERHHFGVSSATIRNDMVALEEDGYIIQPHTSAGRVPTDKGYRLFVDRLSEIKPLSAAERRAVQTFLHGAVDLDDVLRRSVRLLAQLTRQVAVIQYPTLSRSTVPTAEARSHGFQRATGVSRVPSLTRSVIMLAAASDTQAWTPHTASQVNTPSQPCCSPSTATSAKSLASAYGTTKPNRITPTYRQAPSATRERGSPGCASVL